MTGLWPLPGIQVLRVECNAAALPVECACEGPECWPQRVFRHCKGVGDTQPWHLDLVAALL